MSLQSHMIQRQNFEIQLESFSDSVEVQNEIAGLFYEKLLPRMEMLFDELAGQKYLVTVDTLEIDCGRINSLYWKEELVEQTIRHLRQQLAMSEKKEIIKDHSGRTDVANLRSVDSFLFFLERGYLPWNSRVHGIMELENAISERIRSNEKAAREITVRSKNLIRQQPASAERLVYNFSEAFLRKFIHLLAKGKMENWEEIFLSLKGSTSPQQLTPDCSLLIKVLADDQAEFPTAFSSRLPENDKSAEAITPAENLSEIPSRSRGLEQENSQEGDVIYIRNAGMVILHPFLNELFTTTGLVVDKRWKDSHSPHEAIATLEFLVSGKEEFSEVDFPLNKILCGLPIDKVWQPVEKLKEEVMVECEELLLQVIHHWAVLKNTSVDGLRETFLQRNGKLRQVENGWSLQIEQKGVDILLNSLPWGIGTIKLPWTDEKIYVEWI